MKTILTAMQDQSLFGKTFRRGLLRGDSWIAWRAALSVLFGLPIDDEARKIVETHTARTDLPMEHQFSEAWFICGRRSGKSIIAGLVAVYLAALRDYSDVLAPGEIGVLPIIAPDRKQCRVILNYILGFFESSPVLSRMVKEKLKESIELTNRIRIEVHTASFRTVRGYTAIGAILDEVAFLPTDESANPASELLAALVPAMSTIPNALLLAISSPYARRGVLWETYREHFGKNGSRVLVFQADTRSMNPTVSRVVIETAYLRDRAAARAEYGAEFRSDIEAFLSVEAVESRVIVGRLELPPAAGKTYVAFTDPSGGSHDSWTLAVAHDENGVAVLDCVREREPPFSPAEVVKEFSALLKTYRVSEVRGDKYAGEFPRELFQKCGVMYRTSERTRSEIYLEFLPRVMGATVELLDNQRLVTQLTGLDRWVGRGRDIIDHAPGGHDDVANAVAGVLVHARGGSMEWFIAQAGWATKPVTLTQEPHPTARQVHQLAMEQAGMPVKRPMRSAVRAEATNTVGPSACTECGSVNLFRSSKGAKCMKCNHIMPAASREVNIATPGADRGEPRQ